MYSVSPWRIPPAARPHAPPSTRPSSATATRPSWRSSIAAQARADCGRTIIGPRRQALCTWLQGLFGNQPACVTHPPWQRLKLSTATPSVGDLIVFNHTYDANHNQQLDDWRNDAGIVLATAAQHIHFVYLSASQVIRLGELDLQSPHLRRDDARILNSYLRPIAPTDAPATRYLAAELFAGYVTLRPP